METVDNRQIIRESQELTSLRLGRTVRLDLFLPAGLEDPTRLSLLLINDGQLLDEMQFGALLGDGYASGRLKPVLCVGIHAGPDRKMEYGVAAQPDFMGRGARAAAYTAFVLDELLPFIQGQYRIPAFRDRAFAGFSLGGLMALDIVWNHPGLFQLAGVFSGSLWWRSLDQDDPAYRDDHHRIMQQQLRAGAMRPGMRFFFQCGNKDETQDRNHNGIIDSIDDTLAVIAELEAKGYRVNQDIYYLEMPEGRHDPATWAQAMPQFLQWGWGTA
ncbi:MAG TPA: alpha/beta hydrolase-fold protein [Chitinophagaceae bacterium]|nr:alpha/beta hydrolase-fold protein [Chitinophagaceae bacterium]